MCFCVSSAAAGSDYESVLITVTFPKGSVEGGALSCIEVIILDDLTLERNSEDFTLHITGVEDNVHLHKENLTVYIIDDDSELIIV